MTPYRYAVSKLPPTRGTRVAERAGKVPCLDVQSHIGHRTVAEQAAQRAAALVVRVASDVAVKILQAAQHR